MTWQDANNFCASQYGTTLATITSEEEVAEIQNLVNADSAPRFYIGLNDHESEGTWKWASGYECDGGNCASEGWLPWCDFNGIVAPWSMGSQFDYNDDDCGEIANVNDVRDWGDWPCAESSSVYDGDCSFARPFFCDKPAPPTEESSTFFVNYGLGCNGLGVEDMHGGGTGEYEDCVCDAFFEGARAVTVAEAISGSVSFPESAVPELHSPKYLTFSCRDEPSPDVCSDEAGSDHRWGVESGTALPSSGVPASSFVRYDLYHTNNEGERLNGYLLCVPPEATSVPTDAATSSHWVVAGHPLDSVWISRDDEYSEILPLVECVEDSSLVASISAGEGPQIAVTCCNDDGSLLPADDLSPPYWHEQTFSEAKGFCESLDGDYRLCTRTELLSRKFANEVMGNKNGERYNWVSDECALSTEPEEPTSHYVARGKPTSGQFEDDTEDGEVVFYCEDDDAYQAAYLSTRSTIVAIDARMIGVSCCNDDGEGWRPAMVSDSLQTDCYDADFDHAATFAEAEAMCTANGYRLCTLQEMLSGMTEGTGCYYNHVYNWVSDACESTTSSSSGHHALANERQEMDSLDTEGAPNAAAGSFEDSLPMVVGAAAGIVVIAGIVALVVVSKKRKRAGKKKETGMPPKHQIPEVSASVDNVGAAASEDGGDTL